MTQNVLETNIKKNDEDEKGRNDELGGGADSCEDELGVENSPHATSSTSSTSASGSSGSLVRKRQTARKSTSGLTHKRTMNSLEDEDNNENVDTDNDCDDGDDDSNHSQKMRRNYATKSTNGTNGTNGTTSTDPIVIGKFKHL